MEPNSKNEISYASPNIDSLKKFTIPRKKSADKAYLEICHTDWREYSFIQSTLDGSKLDSSYSLNSLWKFGDMKLIHNVKLAQRFAEKRSKMREDGGRGKELEEYTFFLVTSHSAALKLYQEGLNVNFSAIRALGNPACGVYLYRHIDVLLRYHRQNNLVTEAILFFKVLLGKVRTIPPCMKNKMTDVDPTAKFDCHMSQNPANLKDPIDTQIINSAVYLYEFNALCETMECPRQCLPYALVAVRFVGQDVKTAVPPLRFSSATTNPSLPEVSTLKSCTVAQRLGRGKNAKVVYQHYGKKENTSVPLVQFSPVQLSPANSLGKVVTSRINHDPRLLKRPCCAEDGKEYSVPNQISRPTEYLYNINSLMKTLRFLNAHSSTPAHHPCANEAEHQALDRTVEEQVQSQGLENTIVEHEELGPSGVSTPVTAAASGGFQNTPDSPAVVPEAANYHEQKKAKQDNDPTSLTELNAKIGSGIQINKVPSQPSKTEVFDQPFCEDLKLYESEVKKKLRKYSAYLVLCDKERISKIQSLEKLSRTDRKAFYCRLKKYDKYYERYQNELGLDKCCSAIVSKSHDIAYPCNSNCSAEREAKPCSCILRHGDDSSSSSTELVVSDTACNFSESRGLKQSKATSFDVKGINDKSVGGLQTFAAAANDYLCDLSWAGSGTLHRAEDVTAERFDVSSENVPEASDMVGELKDELQYSFDNEEIIMTEDESVVTKPQMQVACPSITSNKYIGATDQPIQFNFQRAVAGVNHSPDQRVVNAEITDRREVPAVIEIPEGSRNIRSNNEEIMAEKMQSCWENGEISKVEVRSVSDSQLEEVQMSVTLSKYIDEAYEEPPNLDSLLHFLAARIEWGQLFEKSKENELKISPDSAAAATNPKNFGQQIPPPTVTKSGQLTLRCSDFADGESERILQNSVSIGEKLSIPDSQTAIPNLQITLSNDFNAEYNLHPTLTESSVGSGNCLRYSGESHIQTRSITETKTERCLKTIGKGCEAVLDGGISKPSSIPENLGLKDTLHTDSKELNQVFTNTEDDARGLRSKNSLHHALNKVVSSCPDPQPTKNCTQQGLLCALPWNKQPPGGEQSGIPQRPNSHHCKVETKCVEQLASVQSDEKVMASDNAEGLAEVEFLNESHDTRGIHTGNAMSRTDSEGEYPNSLTDNLSEAVLKKKIRKKTTLKPQDKDMKKLKHNSNKRNYLKEDSKLTSNDGVSLNLECVDCEPYMNEVIATEKNNPKQGLGNRMPIHKGVAFPRSRQHKGELNHSGILSENLFALKCIEKANSIQFIGEPKGTLCPDKNVKTLSRKQRFPNNKALALVQTGSSAKYVPRGRIYSTDGSKEKILATDRSTADVTPLYEGRIDAFSSCKRQIAQVANVLSTEASLSKSRRLSKLLAKAVTYLNKAYEKVGKSSKIVKRIGMTMNQSSLPKSYQSNCNTFWESCDVDGRRYHKRQYRSITDTDPKYSQFNKQKQVKGLIVPHKSGDLLCRGVPSVHFRRRTSKNEQATCVEKSDGIVNVKLASLTSTARASTNSETFQSTMENQIHQHSVVMRGAHAEITHSNPNLVQEHKSCEANLPANVFERAEPPTVDAQAEFTSVKSQVECHLVSSEIMDLPVEPKLLDSQSKSKLDESQMELHIDSQEGRSCVGKKTEMETILELPVDSLVVESCFDSQKAEFLNKSQKVKIPLVSQTLDSLDERQLMKSSTELQITEAQPEHRRLKSQCEFKATKSSTEDQMGHCKRGGSDVKFPGVFQKLDHPAAFKAPKSPAKSDASRHPVESQLVEFQIDALDVDTKLEGLFQCVKIECPVKSIAVESQMLTELHLSVESAVALQTVATELERQRPKSCLELKVTAFRAETPKRKSQLELNMIKSQAAESRDETQIASSGSNQTDMECPAVFQIAESPVQCHMKHCTADSQAAEAHTESRTIVFQDGSCLVKFRRADSRIESKNEESQKMEREEGEIVSDNESEFVESRNSKVGQKAGSVKDQGTCMEGDTKRTSSKNGPSQNAKEAQLSGSLVAKISEILHQADSSSLPDNLEKLKLTCEKMLPQFVSGFERSQGESFADTFISRDWLLRNSMQNTVKAVQLKSSALDSYVELQMMLETVQFLENKISFLRGLPTFRSLLWYDETLYSDLLTEKVGYQQQSTLYPSFQERVQSNGFEALSDYQAQTLKSCQTETKGQNAYYVYLKNRRELDECSAVMQSTSDCCYFCLSVPLTSSVNYGDNLEDLETLRKTVWMLINRYTGLPESQRDVAKLVHLWTILDFVNAKTRTIHGSLMANEDLWWFGLEHIQFSAAKMLAWQKREKRGPLNDNLTKLGEGNGQINKTKELIMELNRDALCTLYNKYNNLASERMSISSSDEQTDTPYDDDQLLEADGTVALQSAEGNLPEQRVAGLADCLKGCFRLLSDQFGSVGRILERSRAAQREELEQLLFKCESQLESLKKHFQVLQEVEAEKVLVTEASFLALSTSHDVNPVLLNPEAVEIYIELIMMYETVHYLRNLRALQLNQATYRGMLWFDSALLPELLHSQQDTWIFSLFREKYLQDPAEALERAISTLEQELDLIFEYRQSTNYTYAVQLLSRELSEIMAVKKYMKQPNFHVKTYVNAVPYAASINYGYTESDLRHNYQQLVAVLEKLVKAPEKDLGKMAHIMEVMKSIMDMRQVAAENSTLALHVLTYQMRQNGKKRKLLEDAEMAHNSPKIGNSLDCGETVQLSMCTDISAGCKRHNVELSSTRKRRLCDSPLIQNPGEHESGNPTSDKRRTITGNELPECGKSSHTLQTSVSTA